MSAELSASDISKRLGDEKLFVIPEAAELIIDTEETESILEYIIENAQSGDTIDKDVANNYIKEFQDSSTSESKETKNVNLDIVSGETINPQEQLDRIQGRKNKTKNVEKVLNRKETLDERYPELCNTLFNRDLPDSESRIEVDESYEITGDITGRSRGQGEFDDFRSLFEDRFDKMVNLLSQRTGQLYKVRDIRTRQHGGEQLTVAGLVWSKFISKNGNYFLDIEDPNTNELMRIGWTDDWIKDVFETIVEDEVIAVRGTLADDGDIIWGDDEVRRGRPPIMFPDVPRKNSNNTFSKPVKSAMISDIHTGAEEFYPEYWNRFVDWIRTNPDVKYLFVAGDIVEGIGVYPDQDEELDVLDIHDQYAMAGRMFDQLPNDLEIFASVGNHDTVRLAEPQPTLADKFTKYFPDNVNFVGNPVTVNIGGTRILMYHGMSINALSEVVPGLDAGDPLPIMELMLKKRHVAPVYGKNVRLAPEEKDYLIIEDVPDVLHCGHVHKYGQDSYNGVEMINTATWQGQTAFQKSKGIEPDVGYWSVINLSNMRVKEMNVDNV